MSYIFSFFSGAGLWDYALSKMFKIIRTNEFNKNFYRGYNGTPLLGNFDFDFNELITNYNLYNLLLTELRYYQNKGYVGFVGGTPCTDFSIAGTNKGKNGINGKLFGLFIELIINAQPDFFIIENVPNLLNMHNEYFINEYKRLSYSFTCNYVNVNAMEFGVPQNRNRIFIYGINKKIKKELNQNIEDYKSYNLDIIKSKSWPKYNDFGIPILNIPKNIIYELTVDYWWQQLKNHPNQQNFFQRTNDINIDLKEGQRISQRISRLHRYKYSPTLCFGNGRNIISHPFLLRSISVAEGLAIQSMPKDFTLNNMSLVNMYRVIANGVPYKLGYAIGKLIYNEFL